MPRGRCATRGAPRARSTPTWAPELETPASTPEGWSGRARGVRGRRRACSAADRCGRLGPSRGRTPRPRPPLPDRNASARWRCATASTRSRAASCGARSLRSAPRRPPSGSGRVRSELQRYMLGAAQRDAAGRGEDRRRPFTSTAPRARRSPTAPDSSPTCSTALGETGADPVLDQHVVQHPRRADRQHRRRGDPQRRGDRRRLPRRRRRALRPLDEDRPRTHSTGRAVDRVDGRSSPRRRRRPTNGSAWS